MCVYSMVSGHHMGLWPQPEQFPPYRYEEYQELLRKAKEYDRMMNQPDCPDPEKEKWEKSLEKYMEEKYGLKPVS